jgi:hypothetical protein
LTADVYREIMSSQTRRQERRASSSIAFGTIPEVQFVSPLGQHDRPPFVEAGETLLGPSSTQTQLVIGCKMGPMSCWPIRSLERSQVLIRTRWLRRFETGQCDFPVVQPCH